MLEALGWLNLQVLHAEKYSIHNYKSVLKQLFRQPIITVLTSFLDFTVIFQLQCNGAVFLSSDLLVWHYKQRSNRTMLGLRKRRMFYCLTQLYKANIFSHIECA